MKAKEFKAKRKSIKKFKNLLSVHKTERRVMYNAILPHQVVVREWEGGRAGRWMEALDGGRLE